MNFQTAITVSEDCQAVALQHSREPLKYANTKSISKVSSLTQVPWEYASVDDMQQYYQELVMEVEEVEEEEQEQENSLSK